MKQNREPGMFVWIPYEIAFDRRLSARAPLLYGAISNLCNQHGYCWANNAHFSELMQINRSNIITMLNQLEEFGYITIERNESDNADRKIYLNVSVKTPSRKRERVVPKSGKGRGENGTRGRTENGTHNNQSIISKENKQIDKAQIVSDLSPSEKIKVEKNPSEATPKNEPLQGGGAKPKSDGLEKIEKGRHEMKEAATVFEQGLAAFNEARAKQDVICWDQKEMKQLKTLLTRIKAAMKESGKDYNDPEQVMIGLRFAMQLFTKHTLWFTDRFLPSNFVSHWSDILNLRNGVKAKPATNGADKKQNINSLADALSGAMEQIYQ